MKTALIILMFVLLAILFPPLALLCAGLLGGALLLNALFISDDVFRDNRRR